MATLREACRLNDLVRVQALVAQGQSVEQLDHALKTACCHGHAPVVVYLLAHGVTLEDLRNAEPGETALACACYTGQLAVVECLLAHGLSVDDIRAGHHHALRMASNSSQIIQALIWAGQYTRTEIMTVIKNPGILAQLYFERPEPEWEDLVKPGSDSLPLSYTTSESEE